MNKADVVVGLQYGDEGKGKVVNDLAKNGGYTHCLRFNGGSNAGHTIYHEGKKFVTHQVPTGLLHGLKSVIGNGCVVNTQKLLEELSQFPESVRGNLSIAKNAHLITKEHVMQEERESKIGTTKQGIGPAYTAKYNREGKLFSENKETIFKGVDLFEYLNEDPNASILCEGAQGFGIDIDWGEYPFVTSSVCTTASVIQNGIPFNKIDKVYGVAKAYETYVGSKKFEDSDDSRLKLVQEVGQEFGATTGRRRQCNWLNLNFLAKSISVNCCTHVIINKYDVLRQLDFWFVYENNELKDLKDEKTFKNYVEQYIYKNVKNSMVRQIIWSDNPNNI